MTDVEARAAVPVGRLVTLRPSDLRINTNNPRRLFDPEPLRDLKENIRQHGVLVPLTVFPVPGQDIYEILDGQRRYQCCLDLEAEGEKVEIPANVVEAPTKLAGLLYMFNIHNYRQPWELMPTALGLRIVMEELGTTDTSRLAHLTGLNEKSVERCKLILSFPEKYQALSLAPNPTERVPSNFWIEANPVVELIRTELPDLLADLGEDGVLDRLVQKYRTRKIRSVIHFRRIIEAYETADAAKPGSTDPRRLTAR
jgi:ParB family transcriptional regulator, chromosome partitioning protein